LKPIGYVALCSVIWHKFKASQTTRIGTVAKKCHGINNVFLDYSRKRFCGCTVQCSFDTLFILSWLSKKFCQTFCTKFTGQLVPPQQPNDIKLKDPCLKVEDFGR